MKPIEHSDRTLIQGKTNSGKTALARHLFDNFTACRRTAIDPKGRLKLGVTPARSLAELDLAAPLSQYIPTTLEDAEYEELWEALWWAKGPRVTWLDESFGPTRANWAPKYMRIYIQQGREWDMGLLACSQRLKNIEATLRTESEHIISFVPPPNRLDLDCLALEVGCSGEELGREMRELQEAEGLHSHMWFCRATGLLTPCAPLPPGYVHASAPPGRAATE